MATEAKEKVQALIEAAFANVVLGQGVSLHETVVIDNYGSETQRKEARQRDEKQDWKKLLQDDRIKRVDGLGGLSFYDAEGLRFHLPAYLMIALEPTFADVTASLMFTLTSNSDFNQDRFSILNSEQRQAVRALLEYIQKHGGPEFDFDQPRIAQALTEYWTA